MRADSASDPVIPAAVLDALMEPTVLVDCVAMTVVHANRPAERLYQYGPGAMSGLPLARLAADPARAGDFLRQHRDFVPLRYVRCSDGRHVPVQIRVRYFDTDAVRQALLVLKDANEHVRAEQRQIEPRLKYRAIFEAAPYPILLVDASGVVLEANPGAAALYGADRSHLQGITLSRLLPDDPDVAQRCFLQRPTFLPAGWHCRLGGERFIAETMISYPRLREQQVALLMIRDVTEAQHTLTLLAAAEERWRFALEGSDDAVWDWDLRSGKLIISPRLLDRIGWPEGARADDLGLWLARVHPEDVPALRDAFLRHLNGSSDTISADFRMLERDGSYRWKVSRGKVMAKDADDRPVRLIGTLRDIHDQRLQEARERQQQSELAHAGRLMMVGEMASVLAHEINQPLTAMNNFSTLSLMRLDAAGPAAEPLRRPLEMIRAQALRAGEIVERMRGFVRKGAQKLQPVDLNDLVGGILEMSLFEARSHGVVINRDLQPDLPPVLADRLQVEQVILNLVKNAIDALRGIDADGVITVSTRSAPAGRVEVAIRDNGPGFREESRAVMFVPFHTTKPQGVGLGLSISRSIIEAHGGELRLDGGSEGGTTMRFDLPLCHPEDADE